MMEFWSENQGQPHLNSRFGTIPGRNWAHSHHDRHQATHYPVYYGEQQDQSRESSYWAVPGSRTGGTLHEYTHWTDPELTPSSSSHFPFILDRHAQSHQDQGEYQQHEARDKDWATSHRAVRDYERGFLREGWQRRWEPSSPVRYNRELSAKRSDSSYRELEAWAARYSHSLPRRRRIEAELRGASQGLVDSSRTLERKGRSGTDPQVAALQHVQQNPNSRISGLWDRGCRLQAPTYNPSQARAHNTSHVLDMKDNTGYQRRIFSQPPGYIAPPPYDSPHKCSPIMQHCDITQEQGGKRQVPWPQGTLRKQEVPKDLQSKTCPDVRKETGALWTTSPINTQNTHVQSEPVLALQHPEGVQNSKTNQKTSSKIIEGRKFRLNKKTGGLTIFCLVSRIAGATETPSLPLCTPQTNTQNTERGEVSKDLRGTSEISQMHKLADEVDFSLPALPEQSCPSERATESLTCTGKEMPGEYLPNKAEVDNVSMEKTNINDGGSTFGRQAGQSVQPSSVKYPLWREPSSTSRAETQSSPTCCITANIGEKESDVVLNYDTADRNCLPIDTEMKTQGIEEDTEDTKDLLMIDATSVVKMELIPSPKKEHVHYLGSIANAETSPSDDQTIVSSELNYQLNQDMTTDQNAEQMNEASETDLDSKRLEKEKQKGENEDCFPCMQPSPFSEKETLEERAERILGISLQDHITEQKPEDKETFHDSRVEETNEEAGPSPSEGEDKAEEGESQDHLELVQKEEAVCSEDGDDIRNLVTNEHGEDFTASPEDVVDISKEKDSLSQLETDKASPESEVSQELQSSSETCKHEHILDETRLTDDISSEPPDLCIPSLSSLDLKLKFPWNILESSINGGPDPELIEPTATANLTSHPETLVLSMDQLPSPLPSGSTDSSSRSTPRPDHLPSPPPPLDLTFQTANAQSGNEEGETSCLNKNEVNCESGAADVTEDVASQQTAKSHHSVEDACVIDEQRTKEADEDPDYGVEQSLETSKDTYLDVLPQQLEFVQTECDTCSKESHLIEERPHIETNEDPTDFMVQTSKTDEENESRAVDGQTEINIFQQQIDFGQKKDIFSGVTEDQSQINSTEVAGGLLEQTLSQKEATDPQTQMEIDILQDPEAQTESSTLPPALDCEKSLLDDLSLSEPPSSPHAPLDSDTEFGPLLDVNLVCPAAPSNVETAPPPLQLDSCEEATHFSSGSLTDSSPVLPPSSAHPPQEENVSPGFPSPATHKEEPQYPKSLWDVVNRIRKHTAPDSENEEEEGCELWDPDSVGDNLSSPDVVADTNSEKLVYDEAEHRDVLEDGAEMGHVQQDQKEPEGHADEDTMSCYSTSSHVSEDTVIVADEDGSEETTLSAMTEKNEKFDTDDEEQCCSGEAKDETLPEEGEVEEKEEADTSKSGQSKECLVEVMEMDSLCDSSSLK